jgi:hypothetical protein
MNINALNVINNSNIKKCKRYQLIKPVVSHKIYETISLNKASKKCYSELKELMQSGGNFSQESVTTSFSIRDIDSNEVFSYKIHNPNGFNQNKFNKKQNGFISVETDIANLININSTNGGQVINPQNGGFNSNSNSNSNKNQKIDIITSKVTLLETDMTQIKAKLAEMDKNKQFKNESCVIS